MSVLKTVDTLESKAERWPRLALFVVVLLGVACFGPWITVHLRHLWTREHYQFFPMLLLAVVGLVKSRWSEARGRGFRFSNVKLSTPLFVLAALAFGTALWLNSPWMAFLAWVLMLLLFFRNIPFGRSAVAPLLVLLPLPFALDGELIHGLQRVSSRGASSLLDFVKIQHLMSGNVLEVSDRTFFVEEACSGIGSVYLLLASAAIYASWKQLRLFVAVPLLSAAVVWAVAGNTFRIFAVAFAHDRHHLDLSSGSMHDLLGSATYLLSLILLLMTEQILLFLFEPIFRPPLSEQEGNLIRLRASALCGLWDHLTYMDPELRSLRYLEQGISGHRVTFSRFTLEIGIILILGCFGNLWHFRGQLTQLAVTYFPSLTVAIPEIPGAKSPPETILQPFKTIESSTLDRIGGLSVPDENDRSSEVPAVAQASDDGLQASSNVSTGNSQPQIKEWTLHFAEAPLLLTIEGPFDSSQADKNHSTLDDPSWTVMERSAFPVPSIANETPLVLEQLLRNGPSKFRHEFIAEFTQTGAPLPMFAAESLESIRQQLSDKLRTAASQREEWHWRVRVRFDSDVPVESGVRPSRAAVFGEIMQAILSHWKTPA